jgi:hypothetical protein
MNQAREHLEHSGLLHRRRFIPGPRFSQHPSDLRTRQVSDSWYLACHRVLAVTQTGLGGRTLTLTGFLLDSNGPGAMDRNIPDRFPSDHVCVKGNVNEIAHCFYDRKWVAGGIDADVLAGITYTSGRHFARCHFEAGAETYARKHGISMLDLFDWEQKMGRWVGDGAGRMRPRTRDVNALQLQAIAVHDALG